MALELWIVVSAVIFVSLGLGLGYIIWGMEDSNIKSNIPQSEDW